MSCGRQVSRFPNQNHFVGGFHSFPDDIIKQLIAEGNIFSQAGAFSLEDPLIIPYIERIVGTLDSVEGLPKEIVERLMEEVQS